MITKVKVTKEVEIELKPGDRVALDGLTQSLIGRPYRIKRIIENANQTYVVFSNYTWRPLSTYGKTWRKVEE